MTTLSSVNKSLSIPSLFSLSIGVTTDVGMKRQKNEDSVFADSQLGLFIVADGMGGHQGGATASRIAIEAISECIESELTHPPVGPATALSRAIQLANSRIHAQSELIPELKGMGTTTVAALFHSNRLFLGHVGDSRCYFIRPGAIWQITPDHSFIQEQVRAGLMSRSHAETSIGKNVITRCVGYYPTTEVDLFEMNITPHDLFLLCSDGLSGMLNDSEILHLIEQARSQSKSLQEITQILIQAANEKGGVDNISSILIQPVFSHHSASAP